jgi:hypothetical protein
MLGIWVPRLSVVILPLLLAFLFVWLPDRVQAQKTIYWGALIAGDTYGRSNPPWDEGAIDLFEQHAGKPISILHWGQAWWRCQATCGYQEFRSQRPQYEAMRRRGVIPLIDWASWDSNALSQRGQPLFALQRIIEGQHDEYIRRWASEARDWGHPFFLRFNWEMNGNWYPWGETVNGNSSGEFVQAWRHVHDIFRQQGANNVTWVWCPNVIYPNSLPMAPLYPGDAYVDWTCMDGFNWGSGPPRNDRWRSFRDIFATTYAEILQISPAKPIMIGETASSEIGGSKAQWIIDAFASDLPTAFPQVEAVLWFNWNTDSLDWVIETSPAAQSAFATALSSSYYSGQRFDQLAVSPIPPLSAIPAVPAPTTPTAIPPLTAVPTVTPVPTVTAVPTLVAAPAWCVSSSCLYLPQVSKE